MKSPSPSLLAIIALLAVGTTAPTVAVTLSDSDQIDGSDGIELSSSSQYATVDNRKLAVDLESLNDRAITTANDVFAITVNDDAVERVWIENDVEGLTFYERNDPTAEISESSPLEPGAGDTVRVGVAVDTHVAHTGTETFTVHVRYGNESAGDGGEGGGTGGEPGNGGDPGDGNGSDDGTENEVVLESLSVTPTTLEAGETVTVEATYRNEGSETKRHAATLTVDGTAVDGRTLEIEAGEARTVTFEREMQWPGRYDVGVDDAAGERVTVRGPAPEVSAATISNAELTAGDRTTVAATVRNPTNERVERTLELAVDGIVVDTKTVVVGPNTERAVTFDRRFDAAGTYDLSVSGVDAGTVTVSDSDPFPIRNRQLSAATTAALAPPLAMGFLFLGAAANRRWAIVSTR